MTTTPLRAVGLCAHYSTQGDWAFDFAIELARKRCLRLNTFLFLTDPYDPDDHYASGLSRLERNRLAIDRERELRFYYDARLGEHLDAGFRVCEDREWSELHRCLTRREFQLLVLPYPDYHATFGGEALASFAQSFVCPVVLVGPSSPDELYLNGPAALMADRLGLRTGLWYRLTGARIVGSRTALEAVLNTLA